MTEHSRKHQRSIAQVNRMIRSIVEAETLEHFFWTRGKIERYHRSDIGHVYFDLVDGKTRIRCMLPEHRTGHIPFELHSNMDIEVYGDVQVYEERASVQIQVLDARIIGKTTDTRSIVDRLRDEGLYPPVKKLQPSSIRRIGIVTSRSSRAVGDFEDAYQSAGERAVLAPVTWQYVMLEGDRAMQSIVDAILKLDKNPEIDVIAIIRGGGWSEHLSVFDSINIARTIIQSKTYIVTGIGHHKDATLADDVADYVVSTPTAAAHHLAEICLQRADAVGKVKRSAYHQSRMVNTENTAPPPGAAQTQTPWKGETRSKPRPHFETRGEVTAPQQPPSKRHLRRLDIIIIVLIVLFIALVASIAVYSLTS